MLMVFMYISICWLVYIGVLVFLVAFYGKGFFVFERGV